MCVILLLNSQTQTGARQSCSQGRKVVRFSEEQTAKADQKQARSKTGGQAGNNCWKVSHITQRNLALSQSQSRVYILVQISGRSTGGEKWEMQEINWQVQIG